MSSKTKSIEDEIAWRAVTNFRRMVPYLTSYARAFTGRKDIRIEVSRDSNGSTDGRVIRYRPPFSLGRVVSHDSLLCEERDENIQLLCPACNQREEVLSVVYHEIAHIGFDTCKKPTFDAIKELLLESAKHGDSSLARRAQKALTKMPRFKNVMHIAGWISPWLPHVLNALEDSRVNALMFEARPGIRVMFDALVERVRLQGVGSLTTHDEGTEKETFQLWDQAPLNTQLITVLFMHVSGYEYEEMFSPRVVALMEDERLSSLLEECGSLESVEAVYKLALAVLARCQELGYLKTDEEAEQDDDTEGGDRNGGDTSGSTGDAPGPGDNATGSDGVPPREKATPSGASLDAESQDDSEQEQEGADQAESRDEADSASDAGEKDRGTPELGSLILDSLCGYGEYEHGGEEPGAHGLPVISHSEDDSNEEQEAIRVAVVQGEYFEGPSCGTSGLTVITFDQWLAEHRHESYLAEAYQLGSDRIELPHAAFSPAMLQMRAAFVENRRHREQRSLKSGKVDSRRLGRRVAVGDERLFAKRSLPGKKSYDVTIGLDVSGSTCGGAIHLIKACANLQAELCSRLGVDFSLFAHTGVRSFRERRTNECEVILLELKSRAQAWDSKAKQRLADLDSVWYNLDGHTLQFYRKHAQKSMATNKIILYFTDGSMPCENYEEELALLQDEVALCRKLGIPLLCISLRNSEPERYGIDFVRIDGPEQMGLALSALVKLMT